jgi:hypothetical protein
MREMALEFAQTKLASFAGEWDAKKTLPMETLKEAPALGMGGVTVGESLGGSGLGRFDSTIIVEELATGCPSVAAFLSIHNMAVWMIDAFGSRGFREQVVPNVDGQHCKLLRHRARFGFGRRGIADAGGSRGRRVRRERRDSS